MKQLIYLFFFFFNSSSERSLFHKVRKGWQKADFRRTALLPLQIVCLLVQLLNTEHGQTPGTTHTTSAGA